MTAQPTADQRSIANMLAQLHTKWPQAAVTRERNGNGLRLVIVPGFVLPSGWNKTICTVLWLARVTFGVREQHIGPLRGFWVDLPDLRLADGSHPKYSRSAPDVEIDGACFKHWRGLTHFWWKMQDWHPDRDTLYTHMMVIRQRLRPAR
jgi:hypothetical protein